MIPDDPIILLSYINTQLRDSYESLAEFCDDKQIDENEIITKLKLIDYHYNTKLNQFKMVI